MTEMVGFQEALLLVLVGVAAVTTTNVVARLEGVNGDTVPVPVGVMVPGLYPTAVGGITDPTGVVLKAVEIAETLHPVVVPRVSVTAVAPSKPDAVVLAKALVRLTDVGWEISKLAEPDATTKVTKVDVFGTASALLARIDGKIKSPLAIRLIILRESNILNSF